MQSALRSCFELQAWLLQGQRGRGPRFLEALGFSRHGKEKEKQTLWTWQWDHFDVRMVKYVPEQPEKQQRSKPIALSLDQLRLSTLDSINRHAVFSNHHCSRSYSVRADCDLSTWPMHLQKPLRRIVEQTLSDDELREIWRDILETSGAGRRGLPVVGEAADQIWNTLISLGTRDSIIMEELCAYSTRLWEIERRERTSFYADVISALIKSKKHSTAFHFHRELQRKVDLSSDDLLKVFREACSSPSDYACFQEIYSSVPNLHLHDAVVGVLCNQGRMKDAMAMHKFFMDRKDYPQDLELLNHLNVYSMTLQPMVGKDFRKRLARAGINGLDESPVQGYHSEKHGLSNTFIAKLFATQSFSIQFVSKVISTFGTMHLEPVAIHQICIRSETTRGLVDNIQILSDHGVSLGSSIMGKLAERVAMTGDEALLAQITATDMHPDVLDDLALQKSLFLVQHRGRDHAQLQFTRIVLQMHNFHDQRIYDLLLRDVLSRKEWDQAIEILRQVGTATLFRSTIDYAFQKALDPDTLNREEMWGAINFSLSLWQFVEESHQPNRISNWKHPLQLLGQTGRLADLERLIYWIATRHGSSEDQPYGSRLLRTLFKTQFQMDMVTRGFKHVDAQLFRSERRYLESGVTSEVDVVDMCTFGIRVLNKLRHEFHVLILDEVVIQTLRYWLMVFVDKGYRLGEAEECWTTVGDIVKKANRIWDKELLPESDHELQQELLNLKLRSKATAPSQRPDDPDSTPSTYLEVS